MEKITYLPNGQWELVKGEPKMVDHYAMHLPGNQFTDKDQTKQQDLAHSKALDYNKKSVKIMHNENGELEPHILLHRGVTEYSPDSASQPNGIHVSPTHVSTSTDSVHTLRPDIADIYATVYPENEPDYDMSDGPSYESGTGPHKKGPVFSFWVPKSKIHYMGGYSGDRDFDTHAEDQKHTSIRPGKYIRASESEKI
jgi:hypothetical protein